MYRNGTYKRKRSACSVSLQEFAVDVIVSNFTLLLEMAITSATHNAIYSRKIVCYELNTCWCRALSRIYASRTGRNSYL